MLSLIESMESSLTNPEKSIQKESMQQLVTGIQSIPPKNINEAEVGHTVNYLCSRLATADPDYINNVLDGFIWLASTRRPDQSTLLTGPHASSLCSQGIFAQLDVPMLVKASRGRVFRLFQLLLTGPQLEGLKNLGENFVDDYIRSIDSEKDPVNLHIIFDLNIIVISNFPIDRFIEELFSVIAVYFPLEFNPPPGSSLQRSDLVKGLHRSLFALRHHAPANLLTLLCDKLDSPWPQGRNDAIILLADCLTGHLAYPSPLLPSSRGRPIDPSSVCDFTGKILACFYELLLDQTGDEQFELLASQSVDGLIKAEATQVVDLESAERVIQTVMTALHCPTWTATTSHELSRNGTSCDGGMPQLACQNYYKVLPLLEAAITASIGCPLLCNAFLDVIISKNLCASITQTDFSLPDETSTSEVRNYLEEFLEQGSSFSLVTDILHTFSSADWGQNVYDLPKLREKAMLLFTLVRPAFVRFYSTLTGLSSTDGANVALQLPNGDSTAGGASAAATACGNEKASETPTTNLVTSPTLPDPLALVEFHCHLTSLIGQLARLAAKSGDSPSSVEASDRAIGVLIDSLSSLILALDDALYRAGSLESMGSGLQVARKQLIKTVASIASVNESPEKDLLIIFLLGRLEVYPKCSYEDRIILAILRKACFSNLVLMEHLINHLFNTSASPSGNGVMCPSSTRALSSTLKCFAMAAINPSSPRPQISHILGTLLLEHREFFGSLPYASLPFSPMLLDSLIWTFRLVAASCETQQQRALYSEYRTILGEYPFANPNTTVLVCSLIAGINQEVLVEKGPLVVLSYLSSGIIELGQEIQRDEGHPIPSQFMNSVVEAFASVLNKTPEPLPSEFMEIISTQLKELIHPNASTNLKAFVSSWLVWCLRALLARPGSGCSELIDLLKRALFKSLATNNETGDDDGPLVELPLAFTERCLQVELGSLLESFDVGSTSSQLCHWQQVSVFGQKCYTQLALPLAKLSQVQPSPDPQIEGDVSVADLCLWGYLNLVQNIDLSAIPDDLKQVVRSAIRLLSLPGRPSNERVVALRLITSIIMQSEDGDGSGLTEPVWLDDLISLLPGFVGLSNLTPVVVNGNSNSATSNGRLSDKLLISKPSLDNDSVNGKATGVVSNEELSAEFRFQLAELLASLIKLPSNLIQPHRDTRIIPVLERLLDDTARNVRLEAARAHNLWLATM